MGLGIRRRLGSARTRFLDEVSRGHDLLCEWFLGVNSRGRLTYENDVLSETWEKGHYQYAPYYALHEIFKRLALTENDVFADYGCGKGRVTSYACRGRLKKVVGVEITPELARVAEKNARLVRGKRTQVEIVVADAALYDCREVTAFYFFNPFGQRTMVSVLQRILASLRENPRRIRIVYYNPVWGEVLENCGWLEKETAKTFRTWTAAQARKPFVEFYRNTRHTGAGP